MPRGPHSADASLFGPSQQVPLALATSELSWLLGRGYAEPSSLKLVGDRHHLRQRQREAVRRSAAAPDRVQGREQRRLRWDALRGRALAIDGFNCIIVLESALSGGVLFRGRDGVLRDIASVHGNYRRVSATMEALQRLGSALADAAPATVTWYLDRPVSNSGRLAAWIREEGARWNARWQVELPFDADQAVLESGAAVATADGAVLDGCGPWIDLAGEVIERAVPGAWVVDLRDPPP